MLESSCRRFKKENTVDNVKNLSFSSLTRRNYFKIMSEEQKKYGEKKPELSYSKIDKKPLLNNQEAISAAVEHLTKHDAYYYQGLPEFKADQKFKDYYIQEHGGEPTQEDVQGYVEKLIMECVEEEKEIQALKAETAKVEVSLGEDENNS